MSDALDLTGAQAVAAIGAGDLSARELFEAYRDRAAAEEHNAYLWVADEAPAEIADPQRPLNGVPLAVKDLFCTEGVPSQAASRILEGYRPPYTATAVKRLTDAGASVLGKTNMDEFAMGSTTENSGFGATLNPWDAERVPGGSSGGSAAAVAAGTAPWAIGTDTGGSLRQPGALCGVVGLKPTYGAVSRHGMIAFASSLDQAGPLTRDVTDAALLLKHMVGLDPYDSTCTGLTEDIVLPKAERLDGLRFGVPPQLTGGGVEDGVRAVYDSTLKRIEELGGSIEEVDLPHADQAVAAYYVIAPSEASANLARFDGVRYGARKDRDGTLLSLYEDTREEGFGDEVKRRIMIGTYALSSGYYDAYYGSAQKVRTTILGDFRAAYDKVDLIVTPAAPTVAPKLGEFAGDPLAMYQQDFCTVPMSLAGVPGISIPAGLSNGLPVGLQITGPAFSENKLLDAAYALEQAIGFDGSAARAAS